MRGFFAFYRRLQIRYVRILSNIFMWNRFQSVSLFQVPLSINGIYFFSFAHFVFRFETWIAGNWKVFHRHILKITRTARHTNKTLNGSKWTIEINEHLWCWALISYHKPFELLHMDSRFVCRSYVIIIFFFFGLSFFFPNIREVKEL